MKLDLQALRETAEKATPGPWRHGSTIGGWDAVCTDSPIAIATLSLNHPPNATHIAALNPATTLALLDLVTMLKTAMEKALRDAPSNWSTHHVLLDALKQLAEENR